MNLRTLDLNLLVVFDTLMREGSVSRTADRIGMSQPAGSHALRRLRAYFHDPLFIRVGTGMQPTPKALEIAPAVRNALSQIDSVLDHGEAFRPDEARRTFSIGMSDYSGFVLLPRLLRMFHEQSPHSILRIRTINQETGPGLLDRAEIDLAVGILVKTSDAHRHAKLFRERWVAISWQDGPYADVQFTAETYAAAPHLNVSTHGATTHHLDGAFVDRGLKRHVVASISHFLLAPQVIEGSTLVATVAERLAKQYALAHRLVVKELPFLDVDFGIEMIWHQHARHIPANVWLRDLVAESAIAV